MLYLEDFVLNSGSFSVPKNFLERIAELTFKQSTNQNLSWQTIYNYLQKAITEEWSDLQILGNTIVQILESDQGFVVVKNLPFRYFPRPLIDYLFTSLGLCLGNVTVHNSSNNGIWDVACRSHHQGRELTFSELNSAAPFHTDSAFRQVPEKYFGLWAIKAAKDGGYSTAIKIKPVIESLEKSLSGRECLSILQSYNYPFCVPPAFASDPHQTEVIQAPIVADSPLIRFRLDTIMKGFQHCPELATPERLWAVKYFARFINNYRDKLEFKLNDGEVVFCNNHTMLHGRTAFKDRDRLLLRIRIEH